jgi:hypothetical protein
LPAAKPAKIYPSRSPFAKTMTEPDLRRAICTIDDTMRIFRGYDGRLTPRQVRVLSMLNVIQQEITDELLTEIAAEAQRQRAFEFNDQQ